MIRLPARHSANYGFVNRVGLSPLDMALGLDKEDPEPLGDLALSRVF